MCIRDSNHVFETNIDNNIYLLGSETEVKSICTNLCFNAAQHTPAGTVISIAWQSTIEGGARLVVSDNGQGIPPQHLTHITERFYRVDNEQSRESGGTGLGLSIVKHIVNRHHGELRVSSEPGQGTTFEVIFPVEQILSDKQAAAALH